jgi:hypothetical protein
LFAALILADLQLTDDQIKNYALAEIEIILQGCGSSLKDYPCMPQPDAGLLPDLGN